MTVAWIEELEQRFHQRGIDFLDAPVVGTRPQAEAAKMAATAMIDRKFAPLFPIELVEKDLSYALKTARVNGAKMPLVETTQEIYLKAIAQGYGTDNITGIAQIYTC